MTRIQRRLPIILLLAAFALACGDYSGGDGPSKQGNVILSGGGSGLGGLSESEQVAAFAGTVYPLLAANCVNCHAGFGPGTPHIAHSNAAVAYSSVIDNQKVNFSLPESSRLVRRLATDFHYCWTSCAENGAEMLAAVQAWDTLLEQAGVAGGGTGVDVALLVSDTLDFSDCFLTGACQEDEGGERFEENVIALWEFKELTGDTAFDTSGVDPPMDLTLSPEAILMSGYGVEIAEGGIAIADADASRKLYERIAEAGSGSGAYSVEAWVVPGNTTQEGESGPARIVTYSRGSGNANFTLGQNLYQYAVRNRSVHEEVNNRGDPTMLTYDVDEDLQATLQHVVVTFDRFQGRKIYVDGVWTDDVDEQETARLWNWDDRNMLAIGNETSGTGNEWIGQMRFLAIYERALSPNQVYQNFLAGVGKRLILSFDISQWAGSGTTISFAFTELDNDSYLFCQPTIRGPNPAGLTVQNIRIQVNGAAPVDGQGFTNIDDTVLMDGHQLSRQCSVIRKELGVDQDAFTVAFEELGFFQSPIDPILPQFVVSTVVLDRVPVEGIRDFARINETMAALTGVDPLTPAVLATYEGLTQQLPNTQDVRSFVSSHQVGISKLAFEYCHEMVEGDTSLRDAFFGTSFQWTAIPSVAFDAPAKFDLITEPLVTRMLRHGDSSQALANQPDFALVEADLDQLIVDLMACNLTPCDANRTVNIVKGACTASLAGAGVMVH
jgi:hypothetical protein